MAAGCNSACERSVRIALQPSDGTNRAFGGSQDLVDLRAITRGQPKPEHSLPLGDTRRIVGADQNGSDAGAIQQECRRWNR